MAKGGKSLILCVVLIVVMVNGGILTASAGCEECLFDCEMFNLKEVCEDSCKNECAGSQGGVSKLVTSIQGAASSPAVAPALSKANQIYSGAISSPAPAPATTA